MVLLYNKTKTTLYLHDVVVVMLVLSALVAVRAQDSEDILLEATSNDMKSHRALTGTMLEEDAMFSDLFPLEVPDYIGFACAVAGLMLAAGGGIGGGGMLVPIYILLFEFPVKHAIPLASVTVLGGAIANNILNFPKRDPRHPDRSCIDWDLILQLEPATIAGTLVGAAMNDLLPELLLVILLLLLLSVTAYKTLSKASKMYAKENHDALLHQQGERDVLLKASTASARLPYGTAETVTSDESSQELDETSEPEISTSTRRVVIRSAAKLTGLFFAVTIMNLLKGGTSEGGGPAGLSQCGNECFWLTNLAILVVIFLFSAWVRHGILQRVARDNGPVISDIVWDEHNTVAYPCMAIVAGIAAGMFGIGGGIVKGPLMLALGVHPAVASATSACMILYTSTTATISYMVYGLLNYDYAVACLWVGFLSTLVGQTIMSALLAKSNRHSYIAFCIGIVVAVSAVAMGIESVISIVQQS